MFPLNFERERSERFARCLAEGQPIGVVRTTDEMVALAGACFFAMISHGPLLKKAELELRGETYEEPQDIEHKEAERKLIYNDVHGGIELAGHLTMLLYDGEYEERYEDIVQCLVTMEAGDRKVNVVRGYKDQHDPEPL